MQLYEIRLVASLPDELAAEADRLLGAAMRGPSLFLESFEGVETAGFVMQDVAEDTARAILNMTGDEERVEVANYDE